ncbi:hypothetical protein AAD046_09385 [Providencia rettgeri]
MTTATIIAQGKTFTNYIGKDRFLGQYPGAVVAYSMRHIGSSYVGPLIRARRSLDSKEQDFYAVDGWINVGELKAFALNGDVFISIWYDQSGNGHHAIQPNQVAQPRIVKSGNIDVFGSRMCAFFDGIDDFMPLPEKICETFNSDESAFSVYTSFLYGDGNTVNIFSVSSKSNITPNSNNILTLQALRKGKNIGLYSQNTANIVNDAVSTTGLQNGRPVAAGFLRKDKEITLIDGNITTQAWVDMGDVNYKLATVGGLRRGTNEELLASEIKIGELIIYNKSSSSLSDEITSNIQTAFQ